jgi:putative spermidine/putrescine transport system substrate-binding protein
MTMKKQLIALAACAAAAPALAQQQLTVVNFGGANANAQKKAYYEPFEKAGVGKVVAVESSAQQMKPKLKAMVDAKNVAWDVVEVESSDVGRGCDEGLFEKLDYSKIVPKADLLPAAVTDCGVGLFVWTTVMAYNGDAFKDAGRNPRSWADFWDTKAYPGKRGMRKGARYNLEFALLADGVEVQDVYKLLATKEGADRAFNKLAELKPSIQWWENGAQQPQWLLSGDVVMTTAFNGRINAAQRDGKNLKISWIGGVYDLNYWAIPKGAPNKDLAYKFINFASQPDAQVEYAKNISYGPTHVKATGKLDATMLANLPTAPGILSRSLQFNVKFWAEHGEALEKRFAAWAAQ